METLDLLHWRERVKSESSKHTQVTRHCGFWSLLSLLERVRLEGLVEDAARSLALQLAARGVPAKSESPKTRDAKSTLGVMIDDASCVLDLFLMAQVYLPESLESALEMSSMANPKSEMTFILLELERGFPSMDHSTSSVGSLVGT